jgi:hypothetical protein
MEATHPCVLKRAWRIRPSATCTARRMMSPQTGLETSATAVASAGRRHYADLEKFSKSYRLASKKL